MQSSNIITYNKQDLDKVTNTFFDAFNRDPFVLWLFGSQENYEKNAQALLKTWVRYTLHYGYGLHIPDASAAVMFKKPGDGKMSFWRLLRCGMLSTQSLLGKDGMQRLLYVDELWQKKRKAILSSREYLYCWMLGTAPAEQGHGYGTMLMKAGIQRYTQFPCYLETQTESNKRYYQKLGFEEKDRFQMDGADFPIIAMLREEET